MRKYPLTSCQKRLWVEWKKEPTSCAYNTIFHFDLRGSIDENSIEKALSNITLTHDALRTYFTEKDGIPYQTIIPKPEVKLIKFDLTSSQKKGKISEVKKILNKHLMIPFDLTSPPLYRYILIKVEQDRYILGLSWHHIIVDATSVMMLFKEFSYSYNCYVQSVEPTVLKNSYTLKDVLSEEDKKFTQNNLESMSSYWISKLQNADLYIPLSQNKIPKNKNGKCIRLACKLSDNLSASLLKLAGQAKTTLFVILISALKAVLYRYTKQQDISIGYLTNTRSKISNKQIGFFVNNLVLRTKLDGEMRFIDLITSLSHQRNADRLYQSTPLLDLIKIAKKTDRSGSNFLSNIWVNQFTSSSFNLNLKDVQSKIIPVISSDAQTDLVLIFNLNGNIDLEFEYDSSKFDSEFIDNFLKVFVNCLEQIAKNPDITIDEINLLPEEIIKRLVVEWNDTGVHYPTNKTVRQLFEEQVKKTPDSTAIIFENQELTYQQLNEKANQLAHYLRAHGVGPDILVAIGAEKSLEMIIGLLGILKAGGAYVPLDPSYPQDRLEFILRDSKAHFLITQAHLKERFKAYTGKILCLQLDTVLKEVLVEEHLEKSTASSPRGGPGNSDRVLSYSPK